MPFTGDRTRCNALSGDAVELWRIDLDALASPLSQLEKRDPLCPAGECDALAGPRRIARIALRRLLARRFGRTLAAQPFQAGAHGKPGILGLAGDFNLAHSHSRPPAHTGGDRSPAVALVGLGSIASIGVDIEPFRTVRVDARRRALIIAAGLAVANGVPLAGDEEAAVIQAWVRLEAWGKADGRGIGRTLSHFGIWRRAAVPAVSLLPDEDDALTVYDIDAAPGLFAAVALPRGVVPPKVKELRAEPTALDEILNQPDPALEFGR